jgi:ketosteroid isomerase-like protein
MKCKTQILLYTVTACLLLGASAQAEDKASVERIIHQYYEEIQQGYAQKDVDRVFRHYDSDYKYMKNGSGSGNLAAERQGIGNLLSQVRSIQMKVQPEATDVMGDKYYMRYKRVFDVQYPLKASYSIWVEVEDTWQKKNGQWRLVSTNLVNSAVDQAKAMLEAQKKQQEFQDEQRRSQNCLNGLGYGCRAY